MGTFSQLYVYYIIHNTWHAIEKNFQPKSTLPTIMSNSSISDYVSYLPDYQVLICLSCQWCLSPINDRVQIHFRNKHKSIPLSTRKEIIEYSESINIVDPKNVRLPLIDIAPIEGLEVFSGWRCKEKSVNNPSEICRECCTTEVSIEKHCRDDHGWTASKGITWTKQSFQTFFRGNLIKYFPIITLENDESEHILPIEHLVNSLLKETEQHDEIHRRVANKVADSQNLVTLTPWLRRTGWPRMFEGRDMKDLANLVRVPDKAEVQLKAVCESVARVIKNCTFGVMDCDDRNWNLILFWLASPEQGKADSRPFRTYFKDNTINLYTSYWQQLFCFCLRILGDESTYGAEFKSMQRMLLEKLREMVELEDLTDKELDKTVQQLSVEMITHSDWSAKKSVLRYFCGILGYNVSMKQWRRPVHYTNILAGLQYCIRVIMLEHALPQEDRNQYSNSFKEDPLTIFLHVHDAWLVEGKPSPFNYIHKLLNYGMATAKDAGGRDRVRWSADGRRMYFDDRVLEIWRWKKFIQNLLDEAEELLNTKLLFREGKYIPLIDLHKYTDDPNLADAGYYFAVDEVKQGRKRVMQNLQKSDKWGDMIEIHGDGITFDMTKVNEYEAHDRKFREKLLVLVNTTCGLSGRGTETSSILYMNTMNGLRNILVEDGQIMIVSEFHKSMAVMDDIKVSKIKIRSLLIIR